MIMLRAGLTGGLGSGKTTVAGMFRSLGAHVIEADAVGRELMSPGRAVYREIVEHFGPEVIRTDGTLNRAMLADLAFRRNRLQELNRIVHPAVIAAQQEWAERIFAEDPDAVVIVESAVIFEADAQGTAPGWRERFDRVIFVTAPDEVKIARYLARMANTGAPAKDLEADARARLAAQIPDREKMPLCDYVIRNDGPIAETQDQVRRIFAELSAAARV
jgi:dephospho-CoA kinase